MMRCESAYKAYLDGRQSSGLRRHLVGVTHVDAVRLRFEGREYLNFSSNDYLGLSHHTALTERAGAWARAYGAGAGASRLVTGNMDLYGRLEEKLARFKGVEAATIMASGFQANATILPALFSQSVLGAEPLIFADALVHASMHFGCWAARAPYQCYRHVDMDHLRELLHETKSIARPRFILSESVFSMDGDRAPLKALRALADEYDAMLIIDDAHGMAILGVGGKGLSDAADIAIGTFSKGMGSYGAYVASSQVVRDYLVNRCAGLIYSTGLPPGILGSIDAALELVPEMDDERTRVGFYAEELRAALKNMDIDTGASTTQIVPVIVGSQQAALSLAETLQAAGVWATAIRPPTVPKGTARLRIAINAAHKRQHLDQLISAIGEWHRKQNAA